MKMHKEEYDELLLRFAKELNDVGVTENLKKLAQAQSDRAPNSMAIGADETTDRFVYRHKGYVIEATRTVKLSVKKCT